MLCQPTEIKLDSQYFLTPSRCPVPSKCHQSSARRTISNLAGKSRPGGIAENHWQSSTWPIYLLYLSTMKYRECANHLQEEFAGLQKIYIRVPVSLSKM